MDISVYCLAIIQTLLEIIFYLSYEIYKALNALLMLVLKMKLLIKLCYRIERGKCHIYFILVL